MEALKFLGLPNEISSCEVNALKINDTVEHDTNSVLEGFKNLLNFGREPCKHAPQSTQ